MKNHLLNLYYGITSEDLTDTDYGNSSDVGRRVKMQALILHAFGTSLLCTEYQLDG